MPNDEKSSTAAAKKSGTAGSSKSRKKRKKKRWPKVLLGILIFIVVIIIAAVIVVNVMLNQIQRPDPETAEYFTEEELAELDLREAIEANEEEGTEEVVYPELNESDIVWATPNQTIQASQDITNILLIGQDRREGEGRARSDSMILLTFNGSTNSVVMTSFLRDLYVQIPGHTNNRLNAAYAYGGMDLLDETLEQNFGVRVDYNIEVDFSEFTTIIDRLGGVDITLSTAEANYLNLSPGLVHMDGETALAYSRIRYIDSDFSRTGRQRNVLLSLLDAYRDTNLTTAISIMNDIFPLLTTDMTNWEIISLVTELFPLLTSGDVTTLVIPADGTWYYATINSMAVIVPDFEANQNILVDTLVPEG